MRPFGDEWVVRFRMGIRGPKGPVKYDMSQGVPSYELGDNAYRVLSPGQTIRDRIELPVSAFIGLDVAGDYFIKLNYCVTEIEHGAHASRVFPDLKHELWTGEILSKTLKIIKAMPVAPPDNRPYEPNYNIHYTILIIAAGLAVVGAYIWKMTRWPD